ncbi:hypothetical protein IFM89_038124 [Coptis chinensis]|uniref:Uncharacterized protein n=1 Tax=Coptis chinensis TaxID=261450 RepID=A0A835LY88_9MAGN|nr:hypothetical protein IFM89_038124 [Coptis chinensis]
MSRAWITYLKFPDSEENSAKAYPVEVCLGHTKGIVSSSDSSYSFPSRFAFKVTLRCKAPESAAKSKDHEATASEWLLETVTKEIALFRELLLIMICKIGKLTLARLLMAHDTFRAYNTPIVYKKVNTEEVLELLVSNEKSLARHCFHYMRNLMLDLSHNELQSIEDRTRYLCPSPLSHAVRDDCNFDDCASGDVEVAETWEAVLIFKAFHLTQLDIVGNAINNEKFKSLLVKV